MGLTDIFDREKPEPPDVTELRHEKLRDARHYQHVFSGEAGDAVLADLKRFCGVGANLWHSDPRKTDYNLGVMSVWLYIETKLNFSREEVDFLRSPKETHSE